MADQPQQPGYKLPAPGTNENQPATAAPTSREATPGGTTAVVPLPEQDTGSRDMLVAAGVLAVLLVAFFFARNAYANALVAKKVAPRSANAAGWWLFILLTTMAAAAVLGIVNQERFLSLVFMAPMGLVALASLVLLALSSRR